MGGGADARRFRRLPFTPTVERDFLYIDTMPQGIPV